MQTKPDGAREKVYQDTKEECQSRIKGVCEGCGGELEPIETVNNSGQPTFWVGCKKCSCFRSGVDKKYWKIARTLIEKGQLIPYEHLSRHDYEGSKDKLDFWFDSQTAGLSHVILQIDRLLKEVTHD